MNHPFIALFSFFEAPYIRGIVFESENICTAQVHGDEIARNMQWDFLGALHYGTRPGQVSLFRNIYTYPHPTICDGN